MKTPKYFLISLALLMVGLTSSVLSQASKCTTILDLAIILDASGSIGLANFNLAKNAIVSLVNNLNIGAGKVYFGLISYSTNVDLVQGFIPSEQVKQNITQKIKAMPYTGGKTSTVRALQVARQYVFGVKRGNIPRVAIVITDGHSTDGGISLIEDEAQLLLRTGIEVIAVGVGSETNQDELNAMVILGKVIQLQNYQQAAEYINDAVQDACQANAFLPFNNLAQIHTEIEYRYFTTLLKNSIDSKNEFIRLEVTVKSGFFKVFASSKLKNPNESNTPSSTPLSSELLKNGFIKNIFHFYVDQQDEYFFCTLEGLTSSNDADVLLEKVSL